ncbi:MAG: tRNA 2-thiouridine(34) synthase MnmA [Bacteroidales bacterium]|nr:tRNA 2-thiouridine(34) synthase MnmA [Bacteroidales bacterium]
MSKTVVVGLSGGVDSSIAAYLLKKEGYEVKGLFMKNWEDQQGVLTSSCHWEDDLRFAEMTAKKLEIPLHFVDFSKEYREKVVNYMFAEYKRGRTPNPDVLCNREVKFDLFAREAEKLGSDYIATGHYCKKKSTEQNGKTIHSLLAGIDDNKEQSYFLCQISQQQLARALFPLGDLYKSQCRELATSLGLPTADRRDSQGICFVGKVDLPQFLQQKLAPKRGNIIKIPLEPLREEKLETPPDNLRMLCRAYDFRKIGGKKVGEHQGAHYFTIGQRKGLNVGGTKEPLYVLATDTENNIVYVGEGKNHPGLYRKGLFIERIDIHWLRPDLQLQPGEEQIMDFRIRYRQPLQKGKLLMKEEGAYIIFDQPQRGVTPGQFAVWYVDGELLGSGVIA